MIIDLKCLKYGIGAHRGRVIGRRKSSYKRRLWKYGIKALLTSVNERQLQDWLFDEVEFVVRVTEDPARDLAAIASKT